MKKVILFALVLISVSANAQNWGVGVRLGDPSGLTIKKYFGSRALELNIGRTHWYYGRGWYDNRFDGWYDDNKFDYDGYEYLGYRANAGIALQLHYLWRKPIGKVAGEGVSGLEWYVGVGGQVRNQIYYYNYRYKPKGSTTWVYVDQQRVNNFDLGVDGVIGLEYRFKEIPLAVFLDVNLFMEVIDDPFIFAFQSGAGVRYNF